MERALEAEAAAGPGVAMHALVEELYPILRSITGEGLRRTLRILQREIGLSLIEVPSGTRVFDWTVPREWSVREAWIRGPGGEKVVDLADSSLHLVSYSAPFRGRMSLDGLLPHLHSLPEQPDLVPYRTSYYREEWGFCLSHRRLAALRPGEYEVRIDSTLADGALTLGELVLPGASDEEVLISSHTCHPALANDNLSGVAVAAFLARAVSKMRRRYTWRFVFAPATIGAIAWLATHEAHAARIRHGLVLANAGDAGRLTYKRSRRGDAEIDRAAAHVLRERGRDHALRDFSPYGYDERQYGSPGFDLPVGALTRTPHGEYPEYHTSADDLAFVKPWALEDTLRCCLDLVEVLEGNRAFVNLNPKCEPQLGRRGLYGATGGASHSAADQMAMLWVLNLSDGTRSLLDVAERAALPFRAIQAAAGALEAAGLLRARESEPAWKR